MVFVEVKGTPHYGVLPLSSSACYRLLGHRDHRHSYASTFSSSGSASLSDCAARCGADARCATFSFRQEDGEDSPYGDSVAAADLNCALSDTYRIDPDLDLTSSMGWEVFQYQRSDPGCRGGGGGGGNDASGSKRDFESSFVVTPVVDASLYSQWPRLPCLSSTCIPDQT